MHVSQKRWVFRLGFRYDRLITLSLHSALDNEQMVVYLSTSRDLRHAMIAATNPCAAPTGIRTHAVPVLLDFPALLQACLVVSLDLQFLSLVASLAD